MEKMGTFFKFIMLSFAFCSVVFMTFCKQEYSEKPVKKAELEIDIQKIIDTTDIQFDILKTEDIGYEPLHKFLWIKLEEKIEKKSLEDLSRKIIQSIVEKKPATYHTFTLHFICRSKSTESLDITDSYAKATFLPKGGLQEVRMKPINDYKGYELKCEIMDNK